MTNRKAELLYRRRPPPRAVRPDGRHEYIPRTAPDDDRCQSCGRPFESEWHLQLEEDVY
jgi:hypothetical protein